MPSNAEVIDFQKVLNRVKKSVNFTLTIDSRRFFNYLAYNDDIISKNWHNIDVANLQSFTSQRLFKLFSKNDSSFSSSLYTHTRMIVDTYRATAYKNNKELFVKGQNFIDDLMERINYQDFFAMGFSEPNTIDDMISKMARNILTSDNAAAALFVQLFNDFTVDKFVVIDCDKVFFESSLDKKRWMPYCYQDGRKVSLDFVNFLWQPLDNDASEICGNNPLRPGLRTTFTKIEFLDNLRKVLKNQAWPKIKVVLDEEAVIGSAPPEVKGDAKKLIEYLKEYLSAIEAQLTGIQADQNIIIYDTIKEIGFLESGQKFDPNPIAKLLDSELIASFKAPPSTVGRGGETKTGEGLASAELVIFRRTIKAIRKIVENVFSRAFTLSMRLEALQGYVKFRLREFTLRPPEESAQFESINQETIVSAWEVGSIGDKEKDRKIRQIHNLEGGPPGDAKIRDTFSGGGTQRQTTRTPIANESKEKNRAETRKNQKIGSDRK